MASARHIVVVEDEPTSRAIITGYFESEGYRVTAVPDGAGLRRALGDGGVDLVTLDIRLPGEDGMSLLRELRGRSDVAVIMITGRLEEVERIVALELGADDYITKPFNERELLARVRNLLRRRTGDPPGGREAPTGGPASAATSSSSSSRMFRGWSLDMDRWQLTSPEGEAVRLTRGEFELLAAFVTNPHRVLTRNMLLDRISHRDNAPFDRTVDVLVGRVRRKIEEDPAHPRLIETVHGVGYVFRGVP